MRIVVAMSGGVDSSVAAALLADEGHEVVGLSMQLYDQQEGEARFGGCCSLDDLHDARRVAAAIGIPHYIVNFEQPFETHVIDNFVREYAAGRTPIPCAHCNSDVKFATLAERSVGLGAERVATGHYARLERDETSGRVRLRRGLDRSRDQSYFLFSLDQAQLAAAAFPIGHLEKTAVRAYARERGLPVADKPDSQEICFVPDQDYAGFLARRAPGIEQPGAIVDERGETIGRHGGVHRFTVGQRKGLGISTGAPLYVLELRPAEQQVVVGPKAALERTELTASAVNWIEPEPTARRRVEAQIRHRHTPAPATVSVLGSGHAQVVFDEPQLAITPGQAVVFYEGDVVVGGGWID
jgi:tRNA-specific 2-thiouridylase